MGLRVVKDVKYLATIVYYRNVGMDGLPVEPYAPNYRKTILSSEKQAGRMRIIWRLLNGNNQRLSKHGCKKAMMKFGRR